MPRQNDKFIFEQKSFRFACNTNIANKSDWANK